MGFEIYNPVVVDRPLGQYSHVARVDPARLLYISGQLSNDRDGNIVGVGDFELQAKTAYANLHAILESEGLGWGNVIQFTTYVTDSRFIPRLHAFRKKEFPAMFANGKYPPNTLLVVTGLVREAFLFEVHAIASC
jgi:enamine deaminase RidA (YjgF/YER057c/UK114 family)